MTSDQKRQFVTELVRTVETEILGKIDQMPEDWDGHELRRYIADRFDAASFGLLGRGEVRRNGASKRLAAYRNAVLVNNL